MKNGAVAGPNPWKATGLEWQTPSPPPSDNFPRTPIVVAGPYGYSPEADELEAARGDIDRARLEYERTRAAMAASRGVATGAPDAEETEGGD